MGALVALAAQAGEPTGRAALAAVSITLVGLLLSAAGRFPSLALLSWLDAVMGGTAGAALVVALGGDAQAAIAVGGVLATFALSRWHLCAPLVLGAAGLLILGLATPADAAAIPLLAAAALRSGPPGDDGPEFRWIVLVALVQFAAIALTLLAVGQFTELSDVAGALAIVTFLAGTARAALTVTERLRETQRLALTDELTGLGNRRHLLERLDAAIDRAEPFALLLIDLDGFKELNDTLGHRAGDDVLRQIGPRLSRIVRHVDTLARIGGDEFALVMAPGDEVAAATAGERVREALEESFEVESITVHVDASVGISLFPAHAGTGVGLLQRADVAMYDAKRRRTGHEVYLRERDRHSRERLALIGELRSAIDNRELVLHYQPKVTVATGAVEGVEALVRWLHPQRGLLSPGHFLPLVEQSGLSRALTGYVLDRAVGEIGGGPNGLSVAVNLGPADLLDLGLSSEVEAVLRRYRFPGHRLVLEVSEDVLMTDPARTFKVLASLRELDVDLALDDFGAGRSSLSHLRGIPLRELKIDRSFVLAMTDDGRAEAIVRSAVELAHRLRLRVVAEGVSTEPALARLADWQCDQAQGHLLGRPMPLAELTAWLQARTTPVG